jgi:hypothetical protein
MTAAGRISNAIPIHAMLGPIRVGKFCTFVYTPRLSMPPGDTSRQEWDWVTPSKAGVALLFLFFHKRLCGPLANSRFHHRPDPHHQPASKLEAAYHRADQAIQQIVDLLAA